MKSSLAISCFELPMIDPCFPHSVVGFAFLAAHYASCFVHVDYISRTDSRYWDHRASILPRLFCVGSFLVFIRVTSLDWGWRRYQCDHDGIIISHIYLHFVLYASQSDSAVYQIVIICIYLYIIIHSRLRVLKY
jgi:hypothetical protein